MPYHERAGSRPGAVELLKSVIWKVSWSPPRYRRPEFVLRTRHLLTVAVPLMRRVVAPTTR